MSALRQLAQPSPPPPDGRGVEVLVLDIYEKGEPDEHLLEVESRVEKVAPGATRTRAPFKMDAGTGPAPDVDLHAQAEYVDTALAAPLEEAVRALQNTGSAKVVNISGGGALGILFWRLLNVMRKRMPGSDEQRREAIVAFVEQRMAAPEGRFRRAQEAYTRCLDRLEAKGVTVVVAAGNYNPDWDEAAAWQQAYPGAHANVLAMDKRVINVSAGIEGGGMSPIAAPGNRRLTPTLTAPTDPQKPGTSFSSPYVAGVIALMLQVNPRLTPAQIREILVSTARPRGLGSTVEGAGEISPEDAVRRAREYARR